MPTISVIIPVYKAEAWLRECVDSVLGQTYRDFELLLVDDGSPDESGKICDEYVKKDRRVRAVHQENRGQGAARNRAIALAQGRYLCFVDADDLVHPQLLESLLAGLPGEGGVACCSLLKGERCPAEFFDPAPAAGFETCALDEDRLSRLFDDPYVCWIVCGKLIPARIVRAWPFPEGRVFEDNAVVVRWLLEAERLSVTGRALYFYRENPEGTTKSPMSAKKRADFLCALADQAQILRGHGMKELAARRLSGLLHSCVLYRDELTESDPAGARRIERLARGWWRQYLRTEPRRALRDRKLIAFFHPGLKRLRQGLKALRRGRGR